MLEGPFVFCADSRPFPPTTWGLIDDGNSVGDPGEYLPVITASTGQPWVLLQRLPLLHRLAPASQRLHFGVTAVYRLRLQANPVLGGLNSAVLCAEGVRGNAAYA